MGVSFTRTTRVLTADRGMGTRWAMAIAIVLAAIWAIWFFFARVTVWEVSRAAHVEVTTASRAIATDQPGRLIASGLYVGRRVHAGEVLAELDSTPQRLRLAEAEARLAGFPGRIAALREEAHSARSAQASASSAGASSAAAARARASAAGAEASFNREQAERLKADAIGGGLAPADAARAESESRRASAESAARRAEQAGAAAQAQLNRARQSGEAAQVAGDLARAEADQAATQALVEQLRLELEARQIRAPSDGVIGDLAAFRLGEMVPAGAQLASLVPEGALHVVAAFDPATGLGRLAEGQKARLRLDGFSWAQYGELPVRVERVAAEGSNNRLRVELAMPAAPASIELPLRHGMTGQVEVAIEQVSPAILLLRSIGRMLA